MDILFILIPLSVVLVFAVIGIFAWALNSGQFDDALKNVLRNFGAIMDIMLPTLREERRKTYSPVLPVSPASGLPKRSPSLLGTRGESSG